jgi:hypothetical protein
MADHLRDSPQASFERALAAFDGAPEDFSFFEARKVFSVVASSAGADTTIGRDGLSVLWPGRREPFRYLPALGPAVVSALRANAPAGSLDDAFDLDERTLAPLCLFKHITPMRFWVSRSADQITVICRPATPEHTASSPPRPLPPWSLPSKDFAIYQPPRGCVHCLVATDRFRLSEDALICLACGRSQRVQPHELDRATLQTEAAPTDHPLARNGRR